MGMSEASFPEEHAFLFRERFFPSFHFCRGVHVATDAEIARKIILTIKTNVKMGLDRTSGHG